MKTKMLMLAVSLVLMSYTAQAYFFIEMVENATVNELRLQGWERDVRNADILTFTKITDADMEKAGIVPPAITKLSVQEATQNAHPLKYFIAKLGDYVGIPALAAGGTYAVGKRLAGSGNTDSSTTVYNNGPGDVLVNSGNGNTGNGNGANHKPTTTTTTSTSSGTAARSH